jgi:putative DNA primase/helicase
MSNLRPHCKPSRQPNPLRIYQAERADRPRPANAPDAGPPDVHLTDLGNARRVVLDHGADLKFCHPWKQFLVWDGRRWRPDDTGEPVRRVKATQAELYRRVAGRIAQLGEVADDDDDRKAELARLTALLKHALKWEDARRIEASLNLVKSEPGVPVLPADLDRDPFLLNVLNGTLDLRTGQLRPHDRADLLTKVCPVEYDPDAGCPLWTQFLHRVMDGNGDLVNYLRRVVGYSLTGDVSEQVLFFFYGTGANGKSTFLTTVREMLGDYACQAVSELLMMKAHESHPTERADLFGRRFVATIETDEGKRLAESLMKQLTGGDAVKARRMRQDFFEFDQTWKIVLAANHKPAVRGQDHANWRRIKLVPWTVTIADDERDKDLPRKLKAERAGILAWAVRGCLDWQRSGLGEPEEVKAATDAYRAEQDLVAGFVADQCFTHPSAKATPSALYKAYAAWSGDTLMKQRQFGDRLEALGYKRERSNKSRFHTGLGLYAGDEAGDG